MKTAATPKTPGKRTASSWLLAAVLFPVACWAATGTPSTEPVIGGPCQGCELVFVGMPPQIESPSRIAPAGEPGATMVFEGTVRTLTGAPAPGIVVYAYHTDASGNYPPAATQHGRLRGWTRTDEKGQYRFNTIRPGPYPGGGAPEHIHLHVIEPGKGTYNIDDVWFEGDPALTPELRARVPKPRGGPGIVPIRKQADGSWHVRRDITLGLNIPDYPQK
jgi:protocatechuate 3,4-dioxygenase, beta subunit